MLGLVDDTLIDNLLGFGRYSQRRQLLDSGLRHRATVLESQYRERRLVYEANQGEDITDWDTAAGQGFDIHSPVLERGRSDLQFVNPLARKKYRQHLVVFTCFAGSCGAVFVATGAEGVVRTGGAGIALRNRYTVVRLHTVVTKAIRKYAVLGEVYLSSVPPLLKFGFCAQHHDFQVQVVIRPFEQFAHRDRRLGAVAVDEDELFATHLDTWGEAGADVSHRGFVSLASQLGVEDVGRKFGGIWDHDFAAH